MKNSSRFYLNDLKVIIVLFLIGITVFSARFHINNENEIIRKG